MYLSVLILEEENNKYKHICKIKYPISYFKNFKNLTKIYSNELYIPNAED